MYGEDIVETEAFRRMIESAGKTLTVGMTALAMCVAVAAPFQEQDEPPMAQATADQNEPG